jgi:uncharacterized protein DUF1877
MGMYGRLRRVPPRDLKKYQADPRAFYSWFHDAEPFSARGANTARTAEAPAFMLEYKRKLEASPSYLEMKRLLGEKPSMETYRSAEFRAALNKFQDEQRGMIAEYMRSSGALGAAKGPAAAPKEDAAELDLDKSWHCLHFLLTGRAEPESDSVLDCAVLGGVELPDGEDSMPYGPVRSNDPTAVARVLAALESFPAEARVKEFDPRAAAGAQIYCPDHAPEELAAALERLTDFYRAAADRGEGVLLWIE